MTKNMYVYEYQPYQGSNEILIVDCGVGFPDAHMYGIDLLIPDASYLFDKKDQIKGIVLTHGHEDHIAALPYILPRLDVPVYATRLTAALADARLEEIKLPYRVNVWDSSNILKLGHFQVEFVHMTHSIPDTHNLIIKTPAGNFYHGSDFKFDWTPVDGKLCEVDKIARISREGVLCLATDCLGSDREGYTLSEKLIEGGLEKAINSCTGKFFVTTQSSNISRISKAVEVAVRAGRRICFLGRSVLKNIEVAQDLGYLKIPQSVVINEKEVRKYPSRKVALIVAGSQAQAESALSRIASNDHKFVSIAKGDMVVFSADPIPGNEEAIHSLIDALIKNDADVFYSEVTDNLHVSGHGSQNDLMLLLNLVKPKYVIPIGGTLRHMYHYQKLAYSVGYQKDKVILPQNGSVVEFNNGHVSFGKSIEIENIMVDGLGIGDVGNIVLRDRKKLAEDGMIVTIIPINKLKNKVSGQIDIISRGFVYMKTSETLIQETKNKIENTLSSRKINITDFGYTRKIIEDAVEKFLYQKTKRRPMVIVVLLEV